MWRKSSVYPSSRAIAARHGLKERRPRICFKGKGIFACVNFIATQKRVEHLSNAERLTPVKDSVGREERRRAVATDAERVELG